VDFADSYGAVFDAARYDEQLPAPERGVAVAHLDDQLPTCHEKQLVGFLVGVPDELTLELDQLDLIVVQPSERPTDRKRALAARRCPQVGGPRHPVSLAAELPSQSQTLMRSLDQAAADSRACTRQQPLFANATG